MTAEPLKTRIISQEKILFDAEADSVIAPAASGYLGVLPGHAPLMASMGNGVLKISKGHTASYFAVFGGFLQVKDNRLIVLADTASAADELDLVTAKDALARAEAALTAGPVENRSLNDLTHAAEVARVKVKAVTLAAGQK